MEVGTGSQRRPWPRPAGPVELADTQAIGESEPAWLPYWQMLSRWWLLVLIVTVVAAVATWCVTKYYVQKLYQATAVLTPVAKPLTPGGAAFMGGTGAGGLLDLLGGSSMGDTNAQEYMSILKSYAFTISLAERHQPIVAFATDLSDGVPPRTQWQLFNIVNGHFGCDYNLKTGNLNLSFTAKTREEARTILGYYVDDLRDKLRGREMHDAGVAVASLREEINKTPDSLLQSQLYELMASQVQRQKLAQVEADFAFTVIEPPMVPDIVFTPHPTRNAFVVIIFVPLVIFGSLRAFDRLSQMSAEARRRSGVDDAPPAD